MKQYEIKNRFSGKVLFSLKSVSMKMAVESAVTAKTNLTEANLTGANLTGADLFRANLSGANLFRADLSGANLSGADLSGANLSGANITGADLSGADLFMAKITNNIIIKKEPIQIYGLAYSVIIWDAHVRIGCEFHSMTDWFNFDDNSITKMDGKKALKFWHTWKQPIMDICIADGRYIQPSPKDHQ